ncbi:hypothetical protein P152DRAFT_217849 [Eremomyces bilateralis CBS 781.70]|uniref:Ribosome assembly protein 3 n=1 Tax=Eremomyces bilateralis CBS 781.70 TaxID=1392243 RepID=A0A6G1FS13_9PEZI|nr:uncharacterized protein P152DRAFT_217849 [Eremomyces bilateralis CBS 781.70]KAF1808462.1 hypothetical protein P152DRAFT_217849 [Eremomyces bilateralis CBS 781.70]
MGKSSKSQEKIAKKGSKEHDGANAVVTTTKRPEAVSEPAVDVLLESGYSKDTLKKIDEEFVPFYLRQVTTELSDDLDKLRNATDFSAKSLPILIQALQEGHIIFSPEQKARIMRVDRD